MERCGNFMRFCFTTLTPLFLGLALKKQSARFLDEKTMQTTFENIFVRKATATLSKPAAAVWPLHEWAVQNGYSSLFALDEAGLHSFACHIDKWQAIVAVSDVCLAHVGCR